MLTCYPQPGKARSYILLEAFAQGSGGTVKLTRSAVLEPGGAAFYGAIGIENLVRLAIAERRTWFYGDNAFIDAFRGKFFRFARNAFQISRLMPPDHARLKALGVTIKPWKKDGRHIVVAEQSTHFLNLAGAENWLLRVLVDLPKHTDRPIKIRRWGRDKSKAGKSLIQDLEGAWCLVTHMSAAANEALLAGVPVFVSGQCAATPMASGELSAIESPRYPDGREEWAAGLAGQQWTVDEIRRGDSWRALSGNGTAG